MKSSRRLVLQALAATATSAALSKSFAQCVPPQAGQLCLRAPSGGIRKVLEVYLRGGCSQWDAFWYDAVLGGPAGTGDTEVPNAEWDIIRGTSGAFLLWAPWQGGKLGRGAAPTLRPVANPAGGYRWLGQHTRVIRTRHWLPPHEAAIPYAVTGTTLGRPHQSGLGAAIWRRADEQEGPAGVRSLVFQTGSLGGDNVAARYAASVGYHGPQYMPPIITLGDPAFYDALPRLGNGTAAGSLMASDALKDFYRSRYEARMTFAGPPATVVRSDGFAAFKASLDTMRLHNTELHNLLAPYVVDLFPDPGTFVPDYHAQSLPRNAINSAVDLLVTTDVRHIAVIDGGVETHYDTHKPAAGRSVAFIQNGNLWSTMDALAHNLNAILDNGIAVLIHSEFGRIEETANDGTEHHTKGYVNVVISDLITTPGFVGDPDASVPSEPTYPTLTPTGTVDGVSPTDVHAAVAQLAGIEPWQTDMFDGDQDLAFLPAQDEALELLGVS